MKFCTKCGTQLNDDSKFCNTCGAQQAIQPQNPQPQYAQPHYAQPQYGAPVPPANQPKKKSKIWIIPVAAVAAVLMAVLIVFIVKLNSGGAFTINGAIDEFFDAYSTCDTTDYINITLSKDMFKAVASEYDMDTTEFIDYIDRNMESLKNTYGKMKFKIIEIHEPDFEDKDDVKECIEDIEDDTGVKVKLQAICEVEVEYSRWDKTINEWIDDTETFELYKVGGKWYVWIF